MISITQDNMETRTLDWMRVCARTRMSTFGLDGLHGVELERYFEHQTDHLVHELRAMLLTEPAGPDFVDTVQVDLPLKPRWIPAFLWRRIPVRRARFTLGGQPKWTYPASGLRVPELGRPVRMLLNKERSW